MRWVLRLLAAFVVLVLILAVGTWLAWPRLLDLARRRLEPVLSDALHMPVSIGDAQLSFSPFELAVGDVSLGESGAVLRVREGRLTFRVRESLRRREPVADLEATSVEIAPLGFADARRDRKPEPSPRPLPRFSLRRFRVGAVRVLIPAPDAPFVIHASRVWGRAGVGELGVLQTLMSAGAVEVSRADRTVGFDRARAKVELRDRDVVIRSAAVNGSNVNGRVAYRGAQGHRLRAVANLEALDVIDPALREIVGQVVVDANITGQLEKPTVNAHVQTAQLVAFDQTVNEVDATLRWQNNELDLINGRARHSSGRYVVTGHLATKDALPFNLKADWALEHDAASEKAALQATATALTQGTLKPLRVSAELTGSASRTPSETETVAVTAKGSVNDGAVQVSATASQKSGNIIDASVSMSAAGSLDGFVRLQVADVPSFQSVLGTAVTREVKGLLIGDVRIAGTRSAPQFDGTLRGKDVTLFGATLVNLEADLQGDRERVRLQRGLMQLSRGSVTAAGTFGLRPDAQNDWHVAATDVPTQTVAGVVAAATGTAIPLWGGQVALHATGSGPWQAVSLRGSTQLTNFYLQREPVDRVDVTFESAWPRWSVNGSIELGAEERLTLVAGGVGTNSIDLSAQSTRWDLTRIQTTNALGLRGQVQLNGAAKGPLAALSGTVRANGDAVEWSGRSIGDVLVTADGRAGAWSLQAKLGALLNAAGTLETRDDWPLRATAEWHDADLAPLLQPDPNVRIDSSGTLRIDVPLRRTNDVTGTLQVDRLDVVALEQAAPLVSVDGPLLVVAKGGRFDLRAMRLRGTGTEIAATGWFNGAGECDISVDARSDLALVEILSPAVYAARGNAVVNGRARRQAGGAVQLTGSATLERVAFDFGQPWVAVNVNGQMTFRDSVLEIGTLTGRLAGGTFTVAGHVDVTHGPELTWTATELAPAMIPDVEAEVSGNGSVRGSWSDMTVAGDIEVLRAVYDRRFAITDLIPLFQKQLKKPGARRPSSRIVRLDLRIVAPDELFIDNNIAKIEMRTELKLTGTSDEVIIAGPIEVLNGEVKFRGRTFTVESGLVEFRPELGREAYLNITARTVVPTQHANYTVDTHIVGTTDNFQVTFSSDDPSLSRTDLVSLVTFGKTVAELQHGGGGVSFNDLIALAPGLYKDRAQEQAQSLLGIDRVELEPGYSKSTGVYEPRVTLGKYLTRDLTASLSSSFGVQRRQQVQLEYRVSPRISLLADWESASSSQAGAFGGEIKFRFPFRTFPGWTALLPWPGDDVQ